MRHVFWVDGTFGAKDKGDRARIVVAVVRAFAHFNCSDFC